MTTKEDLLGDDGNIVLQHPPGGLPDGHPLTVRLKDVYNLLAQGKSTKSIRRLEPHIRPETIALARSFLIANNPALYEKKIAKTATGDLRLLVDECLPARIIPAIRNGFGYATHTNFTKLSGRKDGAVWEWAVNNNIDAIVTRDWREVNPDRDLTLIAKLHAVKIIEGLQKSGNVSADLSQLPVIIHVKSERAHYKHVSALINRFRDKFLPYLEARTTPAISVSSAGVLPDLSYQELWNIHLRQTNPAPDHAPPSPFEKKWLKIVLSGKTGLTDEQTNSIASMVRRAAEMRERNLMHLPGTTAP